MGRELVKYVDELVVVGDDRRVGFGKLGKDWRWGV